MAKSPIKIKVLKMVEDYFNKEIAEIIEKNNDDLKLDISNVNYNVALQAEKVFIYLQNLIVNEEKQDELLNILTQNVFAYLSNFVGNELSNLPILNSIITVNPDQKLTVITIDI